MVSKIVDLTHLAELKQQALGSPRKRSNYNLHDTLDAPVQRLAIHLHPDTYIRPHKHLEQNKWELMLILDGEMDLVLFDDSGLITARHPFHYNSVRAVEIPPNTWHSIATGEKGATIMEIKEGPYTPITSEGLASWSPEEANTDDVSRFKLWLSSAQVGDYFPV